MGKRGRFLHPFDEEQDEEVNLTPLIDVVFVVLIMFILVAPLIEIDKILLAPAGTKKADMISYNQNDSIKIHVYSDNTVWLNGISVSVDELASELKNLHPKTPKIPLQVFHDKNAYFGTYQSVKNAAELAGFESIDVILKPG
ncbi:MAG: biopolymer transporter ExbD [Simkaniaceae bacterium]|nr:biopolymer transporter ExbD [Simkaniaceae bacterium]